MPYKYPIKARENQRIRAKRYHQRHKEAKYRATQEWYAAHPEALKEHRRRYYQKYRAKRMAYAESYYWKNRESIAGKSKERNQRNKAKYRESKRRYYLTHREAIVKKAANWQRQNPLKVLARNAKRRAIRKQCSHGDDQIIQRWMVDVRKKPFVRCHWCGTKIHGRRIHFDHIIALSRQGTHTIGNMCCACSDCNLRKNARLLSDWVVNGQMFLL